VSAVPAPGPAADGSRSVVALLRVDARMRDAVPPSERGFAERVVVVPRRTLEPGRWQPEGLLDRSVRPFAAMLLHGLVTHEILLAGRRSANLLGPGDVFRPWRSADTCLPCDPRWTAGGRAEIALLDERFVMATRKWPDLSVVVYERLAEQLEVAAVRAAIVGLPRVEARLLALFWQLADRWGVVTGDGIVVRLPLTHALLGHLVGAQRPTVSLALQALADAELLRRGGDGAWILAHDSARTLASNGARFGQRRTAGARSSPSEPHMVAAGAERAIADGADGRSPARGAVGH
jgi:CRP/FNR family transcriptional regulator, cyclic AMP receptor protein